MNSSVVVGPVNYFYLIPSHWPFCCHLIFYLVGLSSIGWILVSSTLLWGSLFFLGFAAMIYYEYKNYQQQKPHRLIAFKIVATNHWQLYYADGTEELAELDERSILLHRLAILYFNIITPSLKRYTQILFPDSLQLDAFKQVIWHARWSREARVR